jgi:hypothetical protein
LDSCAAAVNVTPRIKTGMRAFIYRTPQAPAAPF